jgi:hypothetical protein
MPAPQRRYRLPQLAGDLEPIGIGGRTGTHGVCREVFMLFWLCLALHLTGIWPLFKAWQANRHTALFPTIQWLIAAWVGWAWSLLALARAWPDIAAVRYVALSLSCAATVAVLGARRPALYAWNFVVAALLLVTLLPVAEMLLRGPFQLDMVRAFFVSGLTTVAILNYVPTRLGWGAVFFGLGAFLEIGSLVDIKAGSRGPMALAGAFLLALSPWVGLITLSSLPIPASAFDRTWFDFRDRFGMMWSQRLREQFNRAAMNAGWPVILYWNGLRVMAGEHLPTREEQDEILKTLKALMKRFMDSEPTAPDGEA